MAIFEALDFLKINYEVLEHEAISTIEQAKKVSDQIEGLGCKCLFLKDKKKHYYLVLLDEDKRIDMKSFAHIANCSRISFASDIELEQILHLKPGSVTPLGIMNDRENLVSVWIEDDLKEKKVLVHPDCNTKTVSLLVEDLIRFMEHFNHEYHFFNADMKEDERISF